MAKRIPPLKHINTLRLPKMGNGGLDISPKGATRSDYRGKCKFCRSATHKSADCPSLTTHEAAVAEPESKDAKKKKASNERLKAAMTVFNAEAKIHVDAIGKHRDSLRKLVSAYEDILESVDGGFEDLEAGMRQVSDGIDRISERA